MKRRLPKAWVLPPTNAMFSGVALPVRADHRPVGDRRRHLEEQDDTEERTDDPLHRVPAATLGKLLGIDRA